MCGEKSEAKATWDHRKRPQVVASAPREFFKKAPPNKVGAIWFPFEIQPKEKTNHWATLAYQRYEVDMLEGNGVSFIPFITAYKPESNIDWTKELPEGKVRKARPTELPIGMQMAFISEVPLVEPRLYLPHLFERFNQWRNLRKA